MGFVAGNATQADNDDFDYATHADVYHERPQNEDDFMLGSDTLKTMNMVAENIRWLCAFHQVDKIPDLPPRTFTRVRCCWHNTLCFGQYTDPRTGILWKDCYKGPAFTLPHDVPNITAEDLTCIADAIYARREAAKEKGKGKGGGKDNDVENCKGIQMGQHDGPGMTGLSAICILIENSAIEDIYQEKYLHQQLSQFP